MGPGCRPRHSMCLSRRDWTVDFSHGDPCSWPVLPRFDSLSLVDSAIIEFRGENAGIEYLAE